jgi:hypothetical protein
MFLQNINDYDIYYKLIFKRGSFFMFDKNLLHFIF